MMQVIDVEKLLMKLYDRYESRVNNRPNVYSHDFEYYCGKQDELDYITENIVKEQKSFTVEPVYHGHWIYDYSEKYLSIECSKCGSKYEEQIGGFRYCPHCGADMENNNTTIKLISNNNAELLGKETNLLQTIEECGELIKAICKYNRTLGIGQKTEVTKEDAYKNLIEEVADVLICLEQLIYLHGIDDEVSDAKVDALIKVAKRYGGEKINL